MSTVGTNKRSAATVAAMLELLYDQRFGGKENGRFRISRKFLREIARRQRISDDFLDELADELFELGFVLINAETFLAVLNQRLLNGYRRATKAAIEQVQRAFLEEELADVPEEAAQ